WLEEVLRSGAAVVTGLPAVPGGLVELIECFGTIRETNYGRLFDVRTVADPINLAYTGLALGAHTDNPYRDPTPGLQGLHCIVSDIDGGDSTLVDGLAVAEALRAQRPDDYRTLCTTVVGFRYASGDVDLRVQAPVLQVGADDALQQIRFNTRSCVPPAGSESDDWYRAYRELGRMLRDPAFERRLRLTP